MVEQIGLPRAAPRQTHITYILHTWAASVPLTPHALCQQKHHQTTRMSAEANKHKVKKIIYNRICAAHSSRKRKEKKTFRRTVSASSITSLACTMKESIFFLMLMTREM